MIMHRHFKLPLIHRIRLVLTLSSLLLPVSLLPSTTHAESEPDSLFPSGEAFQPFKVTLQPQITTNPLPFWDEATSGSLSIQTNSDSITLGIPPLAAQDEIGCFALTIVFQDNGDGGPVVEWVSSDGSSTLLSAGLGENGVAIGLNSRTLLIGQSLALDGGKVKVSFAGRFQRLLSVTLRPARNVELGSVDWGNQPALLDGKDHVLDALEVTGSDMVLSRGDSYKGAVVDAELSALPVRLDQPGGQAVLEFDVPLADIPAGSYLHTQVGGLDPASSILVEINGVQYGALQLTPFSLDDPSVLFSTSGRLLVAGWRNGSLFLPSNLFQKGENSIVLTLQRPPGDEGKPVFLQKTRIEVLLSAPATSSATHDSPQPDSKSSAKPAMSSLQRSSLPTSLPSPTDKTLSTGSLYGDPPPSLFHAPTPNSLHP